MLTNREAADWRRCEGTVSAPARGPDPRSWGGSPAVRGQAFIQAARPRRIRRAYPYELSIEPDCVMARLRIASYRVVQSSSARTGTWSRGTSGIRGLFFVGAPRRVRCCGDGPPGRSALEPVPR